MLLLANTGLIALASFLLATVPPALCVIVPSPAPTVVTSQATFVGYTSTIDDQPIDRFLGVRYAQAPLADLRFRQPRAMQASNSTQTVNKYGATCLQGSFNLGQSEDCLFLNIIRPSDQPADLRLPVMVWIHGGSFQRGSGKWDGTRLVAESVRLNAPIIFVSMNYRLGAFGFLGGSAMLAAAKKGTASLNVGMYDTRMALSWVQEHIAAFGGDPGKVTIAGQSAGAFIVANTLLSNRHNAAGLYHAAIMESGFPGGSSTLHPDHPRHEQTFSQISREVGCSAQPSDLSCLKSVSASRLAAASNQATSSFRNTPQLGAFPFVPMQDSQVDGFWFSAPPRDLVDQDQIASVPVIAGHNLDEGTSGAAPKTLESGDEFAAYVQDLAFADTTNRSLADSVLKGILSTFPDDLTKGSPFPNLATAVSKGTTDLSDPYFGDENNQFKRAASFYGAWRYIAPHRRFVQKHAAANPVWSYLFAQRDKQVIGWHGVAHGAELPYVFGNVQNVRSSGLYKPLNQTIQRAWISFVNHHDPRRLGLVNWPPYTPTGQATLQLKGQAVRVIKDTARANQLEFIKSDDVAKVFSS
ncbi:hypothetical protein V8E36_009791 [Tilletia maclaganii]